jgi:Tfp pilus assembly protein FimT
MTESKKRDGLRQGHGERGFSALELVMVVFIISAVSLVALPELMDARQDYRLASVAREISGNLSNARIRAISDNTDYRVRVDTVTTYVLEQETALNTWTGRNTYLIPDGFAFSATGSIVEFHHRGNASPVATLTVENPNNLTRSIVTTTAGRTYVQ